MTRPANPELPSRILDVAEQIVASEGHHVLNMRRLANGVGITPTTLYYYFASKEHILGHLRLRTAKRLNGKVRRTASSDPRQAIRALADAYLAFAEDNPRLYRLFTEQSLDEAFPGDVDGRALHAAYYATLQELDTLKKWGEEERDSRLWAMIGWVLLHGFSSLMIGGTLETVVGLDRAKLKESFLDVYTNGVAGERARGEK